MAALHLRRLVVRVALALTFILTGADLAVPHAAASENGLARTPPLGWSTWYAFDCEGYTDATIVDMVDRLTGAGLRDAGYRYVNLDDCWQALDRAADGQIVPDPRKFPRGLGPTIAYIHNHGLRVGLYTAAGEKTCGGRPGSLGHERQDARTYARWGVDFVKEDWCGDMRGLDQARQYALMRDALAATGRPMVLSAASAGTGAPWTWGPGTANMWRTTFDISYSWERILANFDGNARHAGAARPGAWNDPDMLQTGQRGRAPDRQIEEQAQLSLWAISAAPLIISTDLRDLSEDARDLLVAPEVLAVDQDPDGVQGTKVADDGRGGHAWARPLRGGDWALVLLNRGDAPARVAVRWSDVSPLWASMAVRDLWARADRGVVAGGTGADLPAHGTALLRLTPATSRAPFLPVPSPSAASPGPSAMPISGTPASLPAASAPAADSGAGPAYFRETGHTLAGPFLAYWRAHGGLAIFGLPLSEPFAEVSPTDGRTYTVQYFERNRFEYHPEHAGTAYEVLLGLLGNDVTKDRQFDPALAPFESTDTRAYFPATQHSLSGDFLHYWRANGGLAVFGYPLSEPFAEVSPTDGRTYTVQYFERNRFESHPEHAGTAYAVLLGLLGSDLACRAGYLGP